MERCRQGNISPKKNHTLKQLSKRLSRICRHAPDRPRKPVWSLTSFDDHDGWVNLVELVNEFPWRNGRKRQDGYNPKQDEAKVIAANLYGRTVDQLAAIMMEIAHVREPD
eukprot:3458858-Pyramimonas_sp.AAC.1